MAGIFSAISKSARIPLKGYADPGIFKIYYLDVGLLTAMANIPLYAISTKLYSEEPT